MGEAFRSFRVDSGALVGCFSHAETPDVAALVDLLVADDVVAARALADRVLSQFGREFLLHDILAPAARLLGDLWHRDICDFVTVTLGVCRIEQFMRDTEAFGRQNAWRHGPDRNGLLLPAPGEQHGFGLAMVADAFREGGWYIRSGPAVARDVLTRLVRQEWFDMVGFSIAADRAIDGLAACIDGVRHASCNKRLYVMVGGPAVARDPGLLGRLGADATADDAQGALAKANEFFETTVMPGLRQPVSTFVDNG